MSAPRRSTSSKPSAALFPIFPTRRPPPKQAWPWWTVLHPLPSTSPPRIERAKPPPSFLLLLPLASSVNISLSVGAVPTACPRGDQSRPQQHLHTSPHIIFLEGQSFPDKRSLTSHVFLLACSFAPSCLVLVLRSTPNVSTLVARATPSLSLHS